jgi:uncharacterized lipoprotein YddW (UPF0748 family)
MAVCVSAFLMAGAASAGTVYGPGVAQPPPVQREFRGVWVATVGNVDWPSKPGEPVAQQKAELLAILDRAAGMNLNAVVLQVRPCCDAMYESRLEPWSYYLTGTMGRPPEPYYDPLAFAVAEAHRRGLELHAWFSPYRAGRLSDKAVASPEHVSRLHPEWVRKYGDLLWLDPGIREVDEYNVRVVTDVVSRYDIDGVTFDDRLGYPEPDPQRKGLEFPDAATYGRYRAGGGQLARDDWRRGNIDDFVHHVYDAVKAVKPWVKVGIAPRGIWQNGQPPQIKGGGSYSLLFADSRKWLAEGWLDYCSPQLYWDIAGSDQSFPVLLNWWREQNPHHRNLWPGLETRNAGVKWPDAEVAAQVRIIRDYCDGASGEIHYSATCLVHNQGGIAVSLADGVYARPAIVPASSWLEHSVPGKPGFSIDDAHRARWEPMNMTNGVSVWLWQTRTGNEWQTRILPGQTRDIGLTAAPDVVALTGIDRCGVASPPAILQKKEATGR